MLGRKTGYSAVFRLLMVTAITASVSLCISATATAKDAEKPQGKKSGATAKKGMKGTAKGKMTEEGAVDRVMQMPEVKAFFKDVSKSKIAKPAIDLDRKEGDAYVVHVYEVVNDGPEQSHTATKNWYYVNIKTGKITKEF